MKFKSKNLIAAMLVACAFPTLSARESRLLDDNWHVVITPDSTSGLPAVSKSVNLPHDWSVEYSFKQDAPAGSDGGYSTNGKGVYTRGLDLTAKELDGAKYSLLFEGVYERWTLKVNGHEVGFRPYGYSSVIYDITPYLHAGKNEIQVDVDNSHQPNCRWYTGSGINRHVRLIRTGETAVAPWSLYITTPEVAESEATVDVSFDVDGLKAGAGVEAKITVSDPAGAIVATTVLPVTADHVAGSLKVKAPELWSTDTPALYTMDVELTEGGKVIDKVDEHFGIRTISYSAEEGFKLNGKPVLLNGACVHHDHGLLGAASYDAAEARKVRLLKEGGFNAVRTSHNTPSPGFLDECDRQGLLVIDEAFDGWRQGKKPYDYHLWIDEWGTTDAADLVRRDRNHPSIIAWSIGNEVIERKEIQVISTARKLAEACRSMDPTRPVTEALCAWDSDWEIYDPHAEALDVVGYNYMIFKHASDHERCPERIMWQTESYPRDAAANWHKVKEFPYVVGDFVWTGIDYLGEAGIGRYYYTGEPAGEHWESVQWPWHGAYCGDIDITGWRKPISHYRDMLYNADGDQLYMAVREPDGYHGELHHTLWSVWPTWESWNWAGHEGKPIDVEVQSRYPRVKLYLNDKPVGEKEAGEAHDFLAVFNLPYEPGTLKAVGLDADGNEVETVTLSTAGAPAAIRLTPDKTTIAADGQDLVFVVAEVVDAQGRVVPDAAVPLSFSLSGNAEIKAAGSANMTDNSCYTTPDATTWKGRAMAVVGGAGKKGAVTLRATAPGLKGGAAKLKAN
ncbi:MAG: DUF4982 domain-containing protein [Muribaculaceae bacterium]|nr:DUF4982 domain-containing protein [Muribaculaceae bacterium]